MRDGLMLLVNSQPDMVVVAEAANGREAWHLAQSRKPDVAVLDISMPEMNGLKTVESLRRDCPKVKVVILTMHEDESYLREVIRTNVSGYVLKRSAGEELLRAIRDAMANRVHFDSALLSSAIYFKLREEHAHGGTSSEPLTEREEGVLRLVAWGYTNKEVAGKLSLSPKTVEAYKFRFGKKLGLHGRAEMVRYALRRGWLKEEEPELANS